MNIQRTHLLWVLFCIFLASVTSLRAHEDIFIQLKGTQLIGLPPKYLPAELDVKKSYFRIGAHEMHFGPYIQAFFTDHEKYDLKITSSWYHDTSVLPPYIDIKIYPSKKDYHYELLFNLDTLEVIEMSVVAQIDPDTTRSFPVALRIDQREDIQKSITTVK